MKVTRFAKVSGLFAFSAILLAACSSPTSTEPTSNGHIAATQAASAAVDKQVYAQGKREFMTCIACHSMSAKGRMLSGPHLEGIIGREVAVVDGWDFPEHVRELDFVWTESRMDAWLEDPQAMVPHMCLPFKGLSDPEARAALIAYLKNP